jgi:predicted ATP-dependent serine protease
MSELTSENQSQGKDTNNLDLNSFLEKVAELPVDAEKAEIEKIWSEIFITEKPEARSPIIFINDIGCIKPGALSVLSGKHKSRKSLLAVHLIANSTLDVEKEVIYIDTEQAPEDSFAIKEKVQLLCGYNLPIANLTGRPPDEVRSIITQTIKYWRHPPKLIVLDGVRDCLYDINNPTQVSEVMIWLKSLNQQFNVHVMSILHLNKVDNNLRGHIGSEMQNKCEVAIKMDNKGSFSVCECESSR